jgi:hypothetical protein
MRGLLVLVSCLACACDGATSSLTDAGDGDGAIDPTGDGGTNGPRTIKLTLTNRPMNDAPYSFFVAYQDGSAPWTTAPAPSGDTYSIPVHAPSYGIAYGCIGNVPGTTTTQLRAVTTAHFAVGERTELTLEVPQRCSDRAPANVTLSGTITNRPLDGVLVVQFGARQAFVSGTTGGYSLQTPPGTHDLMVAHALPYGNGEFYVEEVAVVRDLAVTATTTRSINFNTAQSTSFFPVTVNVPNGRVVATTTLYTANGTTLGLLREASSWETERLATAQMRTSDVYDQSISLTTMGQGVTVTNATNMPGAQTFVAPPALGATSSTIPTKMPYPTVQTTWPAYANSIGYAWNATQQLSAQQCAGNIACTIAWTAYVSPGVTGAMPGYRMPDLSGVMGWKSAYALVSGAQVVGSVTAQTSSAGAGDFPPPIPANGTKRAFVRTDYSVTP